jgi:hypothetical protein
VFALALLPGDSVRAAPPADVEPARRAEPSDAVPLHRVDPATIVVEAGAIEPLGARAFALRTPGVRAVVPGSRGGSARVDFEYRGPTRGVAPLASGELRRQIGLKLRARDTCNVVYVMWHIAPTSGIFVQVKSNPDLHTHAQCGDRGYRTVARGAGAQVRPIREGERHSLVARLEGPELTVIADDTPAWRGRLPDEAFAFVGPVGLRSDNGEFDVELWADPAPDERGR